MVGSKPVRLRVGVVGLGRLWETRHKPSLTRLEDRFRVTAVYDQVCRRAEIEAAQLGCAACEGLSALVERPDVNVIYLLSRQWFGLHPIALACAAGKPVYCALPLADDLAELEDLVGTVEASGIVFMPEFARRCYPATLRLKELLATELGPPRLVLGHSRLYGFDRYAVPGPTTQIAPAPLLDRPGELPARLVRVHLPVAAGGRARGAVPRHPRDGRRRSGAGLRELRGPIRPRRDGAYLVRPVPASVLGRREPLPATAGFPGLRRARGRDAGDAGADPVGGPWRDQGRDGSRWSRRSATCSTTSSIAWSGGSTSLAPTIGDALTIARLVRDVRRSQLEGGAVVRSS